MQRSPYLAHHVTPRFAYEADAETLEQASYDIADDDLVELFVQRLRRDDSSGEKRWFLFRRRLTLNAVITYVEEDVTEVLKDMTTDPPALREDPDRTVTHNMGVLPAVWLRTDEIPGDIDGPSVLSGAEKLLEAVDRMTSQRFRACEAHGDPRTSPINSEDIQLAAQIEQEWTGATRAAPYPVKLIEMSAQGQEAQAALLRDLRKSAQDVTGIYVHDPERIRGALSSLALKQMYSPTISKAESLHAPFGQAMSLLSEKLLRVNQHVEIVPALSTKDLPDGWYVLDAWPDVLPPNPQDAQHATMAAAGAVAAEALSRESATRYVAPYFGVTELQTELDLIAKERKARQEEISFGLGSDADEAFGLGSDADEAFGQMTNDSMADDSDVERPDRVS